VRKELQAQQEKQVHKEQRVLLVYKALQERQVFKVLQAQLASKVQQVKLEQRVQQESKDLLEKLVLLVPLDCKVRREPLAFKEQQDQQVLKE
jgi:hypothetical protein